MALINVLDIRFLNNPAPISSPYEIEIQFECLDSLAHDLEWKLIYVGSGFSEDVELDSLLVGPIPAGVNKFIFTADPVDVSQIPAPDVLGVSVILLTASYDDREFVRVGFYSNNEYSDPDLRTKYDKLLAEGTDEERASWKFEGVKSVDVQRNILTAKPRVTRFNIKWDNENFNDEPPEQEEVDGGEIVELDQLGEGEDEDDAEEADVAEDALEGERPDGENTAGGTSAADQTNNGEENLEEDEEEDEEEELGSASEAEDSEEGEEDIEMDEADAVEGTETAGAPLDSRGEAPVAKQEPMVEEVSGVETQT